MPISSFKDLEYKIKHAVRLAVKTTGQRIFDLSQRQSQEYNQVDKGAFNRSGRIRFKAYGWEITYGGHGVINAEEVEYGLEEDRDVKGSYTYHVKSHMRKGYYTKNHVWVPPKRIKSHSYTMTDKKVVVIRDIVRDSQRVRVAPGMPFDLSTLRKPPKRIRLPKPKVMTISVEKAKPGNYYLTTAVYTGFLGLAKDIERHLREGLYRVT